MSQSQDITEVTLCVSSFFGKSRETVVSHLPEHGLIFSSNCGIMKRFHIKMAVAFKSVHVMMLCYLNRRIKVEVIVN